MDWTLLKEYGIAGVILYAAYLAVNKLYTDMRNDSMKREDKLMEHMDKQAGTMKDISTTLNTMDTRICSLELFFGRRTNDDIQNK